MPMPTPMVCHIGDEDFTTFDAPNDSNLLMKNVGTLRSVSFRWNFVQPGTGQRAQVKGGHESTLLPPMDESCWHALLDQSSKKATWHGKIYHRSMKPMVGPYSLQTNWSRIQADVSHLLVTCLGDPERSKQPPVMATQGWKLSILLLFFHIVCRILIWWKGCKPQDPFLGFIAQSYNAHRIMG